MSFHRISILHILMCMQSVFLSGCANDRPKDLIVDLGDGGSIRLVGKANNFDCSDPAFANVKKEVTATMSFTDGSSKNICAEAGVKRKSEPTISVQSAGGGVSLEEFCRDLAFANAKKEVTTTMIFDDEYSKKICAEAEAKSHRKPPIAAPSPSGRGSREEFEAAQRLVAERMSGKSGSASPVEPRK